jgi:hypothetical protein
MDKHLSESFFMGLPVNVLKDQNHNDKTYIHS